MKQAKGREGKEEEEHHTHTHTRTTHEEASKQARTLRQTHNNVLYPTPVMYVIDGA